MPWRGKATLHVRTCQRCFPKFGIGEPPEVVDDGSVWLPVEARQRFEAAVEQNLTEQRLLVGGEPRPDFLDALVALAKPDAGYFAWVQSQEEGRYGIQVSRNGRTCVALFRRNDWVLLREASPDGLTREFIRWLPEFPISDAKSLTVPESDAPWLAGEHDAPMTRESRSLRDTFYLSRFGGAHSTPSPHATEPGCAAMHRCTTSTPRTVAGSTT